jgi:hypothetical protein
MLRRIESEENLALPLQPGAAAAEPVVAPIGESEFETSLPSDHPRWARDAIAISKAARDFVERLRPVVVAVMTIWDHRFRCIAIGNRRVSVDVSGSYRID